MYFTAILIEDDKLSSTELLVWYTLCSFARWKYQGKQPKLADNVFPSIETIAQRAHISRPTVHKALKHLQDLGYVEITSGGNEGRSNHYVLKDVKNFNGDVKNLNRGVKQFNTNNNTINNTNNKDANAETSRPVRPRPDPDFIERMKKEAAELIETLKGR